MLRPRPQRTEQTTPKTMQDCANVINYYEHLVQEWELWGEEAVILLENE